MPRTQREPPTAPVPGPPCHGWSLPSAGIPPSNPVGRRLGVVQTLNHPKGARHGPPFLRPDFRPPQGKPQSLPRPVAWRSACAGLFCVSAGWLIDDRWSQTAAANVYLAAPGVRRHSRPVPGRRSANGRRRLPKKARPRWRDVDFVRGRRRGTASARSIQSLPSREKGLEKDDRERSEPALPTPLTSTSRRHAQKSGEAGRASPRCNEN
jgi:hypothetical protein